MLWLDNYGESLVKNTGIGTNGCEASGLARLPKSRSNARDEPVDLFDKFSYRNGISN